MYCKFKLLQVMFNSGYEMERMISDDHTFNICCLCMIRWARYCTFDYELIPGNGGYLMTIAWDNIQKLFNFFEEWQRPGRQIAAGWNLILKWITLLSWHPSGVATQFWLLNKTAGAPASSRNCFGFNCNLMMHGTSWKVVSFAVWSQLWCPQTPSSPRNHSNHTRIHCLGFHFHRK